MQKYYFFILFFISVCCQRENKISVPNQYSGIYPHLAYYNDEGECGTGAVVPWAGNLWVITYGPHLPFGSSDKLYQITPDLKRITRDESIGGTPANRMIHKESNQLFIGPHAIDKNGKVRTISYDIMEGRHTGNARHLTDPAGKIYYGTMEEGFYEVDVNTLKPNLLYRDLNPKEDPGEDIGNLPVARLAGAHGKGLYSGQGVMVYSNNGETNQLSRTKFDIESGALAEWDGKDWKIVRRNQFVEVTGPGGIYGNPNPETDPIWATGWDHKSVLVGVRDAATGWHFYRLPKASHSYDGAHGWNTEWPRIRDVGTGDNPDYLMTMHGMFWNFPGSFSAGNTAGIRPRSAYLKVIGDFTRWNDRLVFGCDDSAQKEFLNERKVKGDIDGPGQSNSNLWFTELDTPDKLGPNTAGGTVWLSENIDAGVASEPFLFSGWDYRQGWIINEGNINVNFDFEVDKKGNNEWTLLKIVSVKPGECISIVFPKNESGEWVRVKADKATKATVHFSYTATDNRAGTDMIFSGLASLDKPSKTGGLLWGLGDNRQKLGVLAGEVTSSGFTESGYYELNEDMKLEKKEDPETASFIREKFAIPKEVITIDDASVLIIDDAGRRWRLPKGPKSFEPLVEKGLTRICREVATERDLLNCAGTFYELPAENADGFAKIRPVATHPFYIHDYASYRGMLILSGLETDKIIGNPHVIQSADGKAAVWAGVIDDLWKLGKPVGEGGPWKDSQVKANEPSEPYLIGFYDKKSLTLSHQESTPVTVTIEVEPIGHGPWMTYQKVNIKPGETYKYDFPEGFQSRWIRFTANKSCKATAWLKYD